MSDHLDRLEAWARPTDEWAGNPYVNDPINGVAEDVRTLCAECRQLRADVAALEGILSDVREDGPFRAGEAHGAGRRLAECLREQCRWCKEGLPVVEMPGGWTHHRDRELVAACEAGCLRALGPVRPPLPTERLETLLRTVCANVKFTSQPGGNTIQVPIGGDVLELAEALDEACTLLGLNEVSPPAPDEQGQPASVTTDSV